MDLAMNELEVEKELEERREQVAPDEQELLEFVSQAIGKILVIGCGGCGCNTVHRLYTEIMKGNHQDIEKYVAFIAINTDAQHLLRIKAHKRILIGKNLTRGLGAGGDPEKGAKAAEESLNEIKQGIEQVCTTPEGRKVPPVVVFLTAGLGGGTGTGSAPVITRMLKDTWDVTVIAIVTYPFSWEGEVRRQTADAGLARLREVADTVIVIQNDALLRNEPYRDMPIQEAFKRVDEVLGKALMGLTELILRPGDINLDINDFLAVMKRSKNMKNYESLAIITIGEGSGENKGRHAVESAFNSDLLKVDLSTARAVLVNIVLGPDGTMEDVNEVMGEIGKKVPKDANIIFGTAIDPSMEGKVRILVVATGVRAESVLGGSFKYEREERKEKPPRRYLERI